MFISEDSPFKNTALQQTLKNNCLNQNSTFHSNNHSLEKATLNFDTSFTDFTQTVSKCLYKGPYPQNKVLFNPFCPLCAKFVLKTEIFTLCDLRNSQTYLIHDKCLMSNPSFQMNLITEQEDDMLTLKIHKFRKDQIKQKMIKKMALQYRQFFIEIIFYHPISEKKFGKIQKKCKISMDQSFIELQLLNKAIQDEYSPNMIVLPLTDYKIQISMHQIGEDRRNKIGRYINFKKIPNQNGKNIYFGNQQMQFQLTVCGSETQKQKILQQMNYKYAFPVDKLNIMVVDKILIELPEDLKHCDQDEYNQIIETNSSKLLQFLEIDAKMQDSKSQASRKMSRSNLSFQSSVSGYRGLNDSKQIKKTFTKSAENIEYEKVDLQKLIKTDTLKDFVKHNTQSRSFQSFLDKASYEQLDAVIDHMKGEFAQLMEHQYGNYMMQKLFSVCNLERRLKIIEILIPRLCEIVMNKQGTHAFQDFLSFFTTQEEYIPILAKIRQNFFDLCIHSNGTHFIQKIMKTFPFSLLQQFFYYSIQNLYQFGCDKNGMCVIKHMMKKLNQEEQKSKGKNPQNEEQVKVVQQYKKLFVQGTLYNLNGLIGDMYGNYVVQFNFQFFEPIYLSCLIDSIIIKIPQYSLSKYSTNVVFKCLNSYWRDEKQYVSGILKQVFQPYLILQMYKNKDGNKILLQLMQGYEGYEIWTRLYNTLINTQPTRFYHDRWGVCFGSRSGTVGGNWNSFSDAVNKLNNPGVKRKNNNKNY